MHLMVHSATHLVPRSRTSDSSGHRMSRMYTLEVYNSLANQQKEKQKEQQAFPSNRWPICLFHSWDISLLQYLQLILVKSC
jgi:hypothetical protein